MVVDPEAAEVRASGGVVWRRAAGGGGGGGIEIAVIHRPRYDDWSLPKGKLDKGESWEAAAVREVEEETGVIAELGDELEPIGYRDNKGRAKVVRYWLMEAVADTEFSPNDEVDELRWLPSGEAIAAMTHPHDAELVARALERIGP